MRPAYDWGANGVEDTSLADECLGSYRLIVEEAERELELELELDRDTIEIPFSQRPTMAPEDGGGDFE